MFKALVFTDPHCGNSLPHAIKDVHGVTDRLRDSCEAIRWVCRAAADLQLPLWCLGDFYDERHVDTVTLKMVNETLATYLRTTLHVIPGNHDASDQQNRHYSPEIFASLGFGGDGACIQAVETNIDTKKGIAALPFKDLATWRNFIKEGRPELLLMGHLEVNGFGHGGEWECSGSLDEDELAGWGAVLTGHFHAYQKFTKTQGGYIGAMRQLNFSDEGKPQGAWIVSWDGKKLELERLKMEAPTFATMKCTALEAQDLAWFDWPAATYVKLRAAGSIDELSKIPRAEIRASATEAGIRRLIFDDIPEYHHTKRRLDVDAATPLTDLVSKYAESDSVNTGSLDIERLMKVGRRSVEEAQSRRKYKVEVEHG